MIKRLSEWEKVIEYGKSLETKNIKSHVYEMYDGDKGIELMLIDSQGHIFKKSYSGIWDSFEKYKLALDDNFKKLEELI